MIHARQLTQNELDAYIWHQRLREEHPQHANKARTILISYLEKYDLKSLDIYLGQCPSAEEMSRHWLFWITTSICNSLQELEECDQIPEYPNELKTDLKFRIDYRIREMLFFDKNPLYSVDGDIEEEIDTLLQI